MKRETGPKLLLHPQIPKPMHGTSPRTVLGEAWWNATRAFAYKRANFHCEACGIAKQDALFHQWLEAHELYDIDYAKGRMIYKDVVALCHACHNFIHQGRMRVFVSKGMNGWSLKKENIILKHGQELLRKAGLPTEIDYSEISTRVDFPDWKLVIGKHEYPGKFKSYEEWCEFYGVRPRRSYCFGNIFDDADDDNSFSEMEFSLDF